jgi:cytochrome c-type biogenesis protein CcmH/NrfG
LPGQAGGLYYNMGKAYGYIGDAEKATESYESAVNMTRGKEPHIYILASTSLKVQPPVL